MSRECFINSEIHINLAGNHSDDYLEMIKRSEKDEIRRNLCNDFQTHKYLDGNYYCIFHLPKEDKNLDEFHDASYKLISKTQKQIESLNTISDEKKQIELSKLKYDFRYVRFPCPFGFRSRKIPVEIDFSHATFYDFADFMKTEFLGYANFDSVIFHKTAYFIFAEFQANAYFFDAKFLGEADFKYTFFSNGKFTNSIFSDDADFESSEFVKDANFIKANFLKKVSFQYAKLSIANFEDAKFLNVGNFNLVEFQNYAFFKGDNENVGFDKNAILDLQDARIEKPERIRFHTVRLSPNWFINVDSRKFAFIDILFSDSNGKGIENNSIRSNIEAEIGCLENLREITNSKRLLTIACRQLAENAENNNRFEQASIFRRMAFETEWLEKKEKISNWIKNLVPESEKLKRRFGGSDKEEDKPNPPTTSFGILRRSGDFFILGLYRITSFYGESWSWALGVLLSLILVIFPIIYTQTNFQTCSKDRPIATSLTVCESKDEEIRKNCTCSTDQITFTDAIVQSLTTATLQNVEYRKPLTGWGELWLILEKIFAPLQAALLALAIRRKFMR